MDDASVAIIVVGFLLALVLLLVFVPKAMAEAIGRIKLLKVGRLLAVEFFERAERRRGGGKPDRKALERSVEKIESGRILWVDDQPSNNLLETQALRMLGVQVDVVTTNDEAENYLASEADYDLVLSDIGRGPGADQGKIGLLMRDVVEDSSSKPALAFYVGRKVADETDDGYPVFNTPEKLLPYVVGVLGQAKKAAA